MYKFNSNTAPPVFHEIFKKVKHEYPTAYSKSNYTKPKNKSNQKEI